MPPKDARRQTEMDPITLEVIRHGIISTCDQIDANMTRTAFSPYIYEYKDYAVGFVGAGGELLAQSTGGMPVFVADSVGMAVKDGLEVYGRENLHKRYLVYVTGYNLGLIMRLLVGTGTRGSSWPVHRRTC